MFVIDSALTCSIPEPWKEGKEFGADTGRSFVLENDLRYLEGGSKKSVLKESTLVEGEKAPLRSCPCCSSVAWLQCRLGGRRAARRFLKCLTRVVWPEPSHAAYQVQEEATLRQWQYGRLPDLLLKGLKE